MDLRKKKHLPYPPCVSQRSGCKVGWMTFATEADAKKASKAAAHNARIDAANGYDFGYQSPGAITPVEGGFEVVIP